MTWPGVSSPQEDTGPASLPLKGPTDTEAAENSLKRLWGIHSKSRKGIRGQHQREKQGKALQEREMKTSPAQPGLMGTEGTA